MGERRASLEEAMPDVYGQWSSSIRNEGHYRDMQVRVQVERGRLYMLPNAQRQTHGEGGAEDLSPTWRTKGSSPRTKPVLL